MEQESENSGCLLQRMSLRNGSCRLTFPTSEPSPQMQMTRRLHSLKGRAAQRQRARRQQGMEWK